jgi:iron complex transport system substrate-binding protein
MKQIFVIFAAALLLAGCGEREEPSAHLRRCDEMRIVSIAPNVTEILYSLGLSNQVVGVSRYSNWPPEAAEKPRVGGTYDPNWEAIVSLHPDLVVGLDSQREIAAQLKQLNIKFLGVPHERVEEIMQSILIIGEACGAEEKAQQIFQTLEASLCRRGFQPRSHDRDVPTNPTKLEASSTHRPKVLVCIGHDEQLTRMYVAARNTFYDDLITLAGGVNACEQTAVKYPEISPEALHAMNPDLIIDISPNLKSSVSNDWKPYRAVGITNSYAFIPGPRFDLLLNDFSNVIRQNNFEAE